ncbi:hypothetical protein HDU98_000379, partial [Podochytrium sp. JEL0797]
LGTGCEVVGGGVYYLREEGSGGGRRGVKVMGVCVETGVVACVTEFRGVKAVFAGSSGGGEEFVVHLNGGAVVGGGEVKGKDRFALFSRDHTMLLELESSGRDHGTQSHLFKDLLVVTRNAGGWGGGRRPVIDGRFDTTCESEWDTAETSVSVFRTHQSPDDSNVMKLKPLLRTTFSPEIMLGNPCCNDYLVAYTEQTLTSSHPTTPLNPTATTTSIRQKLLHALTTHRLPTRIRIHRLEPSPTPSKHTSLSSYTSITDTDSETESSTGSSNFSMHVSAPESTFSFMETKPVTTANRFRSTHRRRSSSSPNVNPTEAVLDLSIRNLHIHGLSLTQSHLIVVSTRIQKVHAEEEEEGGSKRGTTASNMYRVKPVVSVYALQSLDLVTELAVDELGFLQSGGAGMGGAAKGTVKVCHRVSGCMGKLWVWLEGLDMNVREGGEEEGLGRAELVCVDVMEGSMRVFERERMVPAAVGVCAGDGGREERQQQQQQPWIKWRRGLETRGGGGAGKKGAWVFYKHPGSSEEACCWLNLV